MRRIIIQLYIVSHVHVQITGSLLINYHVCNGHNYYSPAA